jgi:tetratricopeptide (TPR) repeat protein
MLWFAVPARRSIIFWVLAMLAGALVAFSAVFASLMSVSSLARIIEYTSDSDIGRYLFPMLLAWFATIITLFFAGLPKSASMPAGTTDGGFPELKGGCCLIGGAFLIVILGIFVLPKDKSVLPLNLSQNTTVVNPQDGSETNLVENAAVLSRMDHALQLNTAGKFAEALQENREAVRLYPNNPIALNNLAWSLALNPERELRNGKEAVQLASKAVELTDQREAVYMKTLAAAYAEGGQFDKAVELAKRARTTALLSLQPDEAALNDQLLKLYSTGKTIAPENGQ